MCKCHEVFMFNRWHSKIQPACLSAWTVTSREVNLEGPGLNGTGIKNSRTEPSAHIAFKPADMD
ncbi:hypothetical protein ACRRTK_024308 [Alexandromys fortis]